MYNTILVPLENSPADQTILDHIQKLSKLTGANFVLLHVANGWVARNYEQFNLAESEEMKEDREYLEQRAAEMRAAGFTVETALSLGEPSEEIIKFAAKHHVDLIAMATHGHRLVGDIIYGSTADKVRHIVDIPVLLLKARM